MRGRHATASCAGGVGKFCRQREDDVRERRRALGEAMRSIEQTADPQKEAESRIVTWASGGLLKPTGDDFAMVRLILLALLPQIGGILRGMPYDSAAGADGGPQLRDGLFCSSGWPGLLSLFGCQHIELRRKTHQASSNVFHDERAVIGCVGCARSS
jgi:hypothetical protein